MQSSYAKRLHYQQLRGKCLTNYYKNIGCYKQGPYYNPSQGTISTNENNISEVTVDNNKNMEIQSNVENEVENVSSTPKKTSTMSTTSKSSVFEMSVTSSTSKSSVTETSVTPSSDKSSVIEMSVLTTTTVTDIDTSSYDSFPDNAADSKKSNNVSLNSELCFPLYYLNVLYSGSGSSPE